MSTFCRPKIKFYSELMENHMGKTRKVSLLDFSFTDHEPVFTPRTPYYWMTAEELKGIAEYYLVLDYDCPFQFSARIGEEDFTFDANIPAGFTYNMADIPPFLQIISYDRHSPFVKNASFIHDYLLSRRRILYNDWEMEAKGITPLEFKKITSEIFGYVLRYNGVPYRKAWLMAKVVDIFQYLVPKWYSLNVKEFDLG